MPPMTSIKRMKQNKCTNSRNSPPNQQQRFLQVPTTLNSCCIGFVDIAMIKLNCVPMAITQQIYQGILKKEIVWVTTSFAKLQFWEISGWHNFAPTASNITVGKKNTLRIIDGHAEISQGIKLTKSSSSCKSACFKFQETKQETTTTTLGSHENTSDTSAQYVHTLDKFQLKKKRNNASAISIRNGCGRHLQNNCVWQT